MEDCIFCKIIAGEIPSNKAYEDDTVLAFHDIEPMAPVHVLIIPKKHVKSIMELEREDGALVAHMFEVAKKLASDLNIAEHGFRLTINTGEDGGQAVKHLHMHLMGGRGFGWPPG